MSANLERPAGLSQAEALARLAAEGPNALPASKARGLLPLAADVAREPMFMMLIAAAGIYVVLGDLAEALVLASSIVAVMAITIVQARRTERTLEALRDLSSPRALVVRDGVETRVPGVELVPGDLLILREGDRIAADASIVEAHDLLVDESLLTGESVPVAKRAGTPGADSLYSGTLMVRGLGRAIVTATGTRSELGRIGTSLATLQPGETFLERETRRIVRILALIGVGLCLAVVALFVTLRGDLLGGALAGLTLAMAILPEEFPVVLTVFLALGAWRIGRHGVLTRRMPAIELLGAATVLCCDKTGTLTENRMRVGETWVDGQWREPTADEARDLLGAAALACEIDPFDPMERAILVAAAPRPPGLALERRYPMGGSFLAVCHGWRAESGPARLAMKGAPETVLGACRIGHAEAALALAQAAEAASRGMRVLAVASTRWDYPAWLDSPEAYHWKFAGLIALADPVRASVPQAIALCRRAGVRVAMITGDHPGTARAIAAQAGIDAGLVLTGKELDAMDAAALARAVRDVQVFARVRPEHKLRIVTALRAAGEVVAMTGDGVNDAPALKAADIGIAMGQRGTDVAREAASLVLLEDDFTSIVGTVRLGRRIYDNLRNAMRYLVAVHIPTAGMSFIPLLAGWPLVLFPVHVVFLEFVIDPACSIAFETQRSDPRAMSRPPRPRGERLFTARSLGLAAALGGSVLAGVAGTYAAALGSGLSEGAARTLAFAAMVAGNLALIVSTRSHEAVSLETLASAGRATGIIVAATLAMLLAVVCWAPAARIFRFEAPAAGLILAAMAAGAVPLAWYELLKRRTRH